MKHNIRLLARLQCMSIGANDAPWFFKEHNKSFFKCFASNCFK